YISTRTPANDVEWRALETRTGALVDAATALTTPIYFRDRDRWMADARLMIDASVAALEAARRHDVGALTDLNDALYTSCVQRHQDYRPNYGRRPAAGADAAAGTPRPDLEGVWAFSTVTPLERTAEFASTPALSDAEARAFEKRVTDRNNRDRR